jgi:hypothetical protein
VERWNYRAATVAVFDMTESETMLKSPYYGVARWASRKDKRPFRILRLLLRVAADVAMVNFILAPRGPRPTLSASSAPSLTPAILADADH